MYISVKQEESEKVKNKTGRTVLFVVLALAVIAGAVVGILYINKKNTPEPVGIGIEIDPSSGTFVAPEKKESDDKDAAPGIAIPGWGSIDIEAGKTEVDVNLQNPEDNADKYDMSFTITIQGEDEPIAKTGLIKAGESALKLKLSHALEAGEYEATVLVQPYRVDNKSTTNNAEIDTVLVVK